MRVCVCVCVCVRARVCVCVVSLTVLPVMCCKATVTTRMLFFLCSIGGDSGAMTLPSKLYPVLLRVCV